MMSFCHLFIYIYYEYETTKELSLILLEAIIWRFCDIFVIILHIVYYSSKERKIMTCHNSTYQLLFRDKIVLFSSDKKLIPNLSKTESVLSIYGDPNSISNKRPRVCVLNYNIALESELKILK